MSSSATLPAVVPLRAGHGARRDRARRAAASIEPETNGNELIFRIGARSRRAARAVDHSIASASASNARRRRRRRTRPSPSASYASGERVATDAVRAPPSASAAASSRRARSSSGRVFDDANGNGQFDAGDAPRRGRAPLHRQRPIGHHRLGRSLQLAVGRRRLARHRARPHHTPARLSRSPTAATVRGRSWARLLRTPLGGGTHRCARTSRSRSNRARRRPNRAASRALATKKPPPIKTARRANGCAKPIKAQTPQRRTGTRRRRTLSANKLRRRTRLATRTAPRSARRSKLAGSKIRRLPTPPLAAGTYEVDVEGDGRRRSRRATCSSSARRRTRS